VTQSSGKMRGKIQATKQWLTRAEEHFDRNAQVRGEMDLLLAEAELRATRENLQSRPRRLKLSWFRQGLAFGLAAVTVAVGAGVVWWWQPEQMESIPLPPVSVTAPIRQAQVPNISATPAKTTETPPAAVVDFAIPGQEVKSVDKSASREPSMSQEEMKRLIQAAGQSLRGRTKQ